MEVMTIFGPPGTGKTTTLVEYAQEELSKAGNLAFLSYTKTAAAEAASRLNGDDRMRVGTVHSFAFNALRMNRASTVDRKKLDEFSEATGFPFGTKDPEGYVETEEGDEYMGVLSYARNKMMDCWEAWEQFGCPGTRDRFQLFVSAYAQWKNANGYTDFDDMLEMYVKRGPDGRTEVLFLDEAQDCTPLQWAAFNKISARAKRVYVAGDDDQAIFEWNGADPHGMVRFMEQNKGAMHVLAQSHRVPKLVHQLAHDKVLAQIGRRVDKVFHPRHGEGKITRWGDIMLIDPLLMNEHGCMILTRDRFRQDEIKKWLNQNLVPYDVIGGVSPWTSKIAKGLQTGTISMRDVPVFWREFYDQADLSLPIKIHLATIHQAKGREHDTVLLDLNVPPKVRHEMDVNPDGELRVAYVAVTRARKSLHLCGTHPWL